LRREVRRAVWLQGEWEVGVGYGGKEGVARDT